MLRILLVEDCDDDAELLRLTLEEAGLDFSLTRVRDRAGLTSRLQCAERAGGRGNCWDLAISDHHLHDLDSLAALAMIHAAQPDLPLIVISGAMDDAEAAEAMRLGARDFIDKHSLVKLLPVIRRELASQQLAAELARTRHSLQRLTDGEWHSGLPNRAGLERQLQQRLQPGQAAPFSLLRLYLEPSRQPMHALAPELAARWLPEMAARLQRLLGAQDFLASLGDGDFVLLLDGAAPADGLAGRIGALRDCLQQPFRSGGYTLAVRCAIGSCHYPEDGASAERLLANATVALGYARAERHSVFCRYRPELQDGQLRQLLLESELHRALPSGEGDGQFVLHYQPQVELASGRVVAVEALLRWQHPRLGMVSPLEFIPILEDSGLIVPVGEWVLRRACRQLRAWTQAGLPAINLAVNLSAVQFRQPGLAAMVAAALAESGLAASRLELEITENVILHGEEATIAGMSELRRLGVRIAIDDFGAGYSSFGYLKRFPLDSLKIDRIFITEVGGSATDRAIVEAIVGLGHSLGLQVVAEGIETAAQVDFLRTTGCDLVQGFHFGRPLPADDLATLLRALQPAEAAATTEFAAAAE
jgi:EAL domain-containing protein (putative c-di-GMP-specific phosphodiesterase class I)/GGDEF domain-containing protein